MTIAPVRGPIVGVSSSPFGTLPDGRPVTLYRLTGRGGLVVDVTNYGGIVTRLLAPDREGALADVVLGYDELAGYLEETPYFGAIIGRYGNRIAGGRFELDGQAFELAVNNAPNHLHGGVTGFDKVLWEAQPFADGSDVGVALSYLSADGEERYPGNLAVSVTYRVTADNSLAVSYEATADAATPVNLTQHSYFNLAGSGSILDHELTVFADRFTPVDEHLIPIGELRPVEGTPFDFRSPVAIGARLAERSDQLERAGGYDHNYVLSDAAGVMKLAARVREPRSGRTLEVHTEEPGMQLYTGNFLDGSITGKGGAVYTARTGFCLESQHFPDSPNNPAFPSTILRPGQTYRTRTTFGFGTDG